MEQDYAIMEKEISSAILASIQSFHENDKIKFDKGFLLEYTLTVLHASSIKGFRIKIGMWSEEEECRSMQLYGTRLLNNGK